MAEQQKPKNMEEFLKAIEKKFAKTNPDMIFDPKRKFESISSGNLSYDLVSGIGGYPRCRISEIRSMESMGKTSLVLAGMARAQKKGLICVLFDYEQSFNPDYAAWTYDLYMDGKTFIVVQPHHIEEGDIAFNMLMSMKQDVDLIAFDSIECMKPQALVEGSLEDNPPIGLHARMISRFTHKLKNMAMQKNFAAVYTNQMKFAITRDQFSPGIGVATGHTWKDQYTTPGGMTPRFLASIRMKIESGGRQEEQGVDLISGEAGDQKTTRVLKLINLKNKCSTPELKALTHFDFPILNVKKGGWSQGKDILEIMKKRGRIYKEGTTYHYKGLNIEDWSVRGSDAFELAFSQDQEVITDAIKLLDVLRAEAGTSSVFVDRAVLGVDIKSSELRGNDDEPPEKNVDLSPRDMSL